jgi:methylthioribulose-1-phosphate dehydratase
MTNLNTINTISYAEQKQLICDLCKKFYTKGWVSGTGGGISIKPENNVALIAPSGVQKEEIKSDELFVIKLDDSSEGFTIIEQPNNFKISACTSIFVNIYKNRPSSQAVIHSHSVNAVMLTKITKGNLVTLSGFEMLKGIEGGKYFSEHTVPILNNVEHECDLAEAVGKAVLDYPEAKAVLVRDHGFYVWGKTWQQAKIHAECYDYLFGALVQQRTLEALNLVVKEK